ncbi:hypothetical protein OROGR_010270 [Orobanche gracilis]
MNPFAIQQKSFAAAEERSSAAAVAACRSVEMKEPLVCPKPRRLGLLHATLNEPSYARPFRWPSSHHQENFDPKAGNELLDFIMSKGNYYGADQSLAPIASLPQQPGRAGRGFRLSRQGQAKLHYPHPCLAEGGFNANPWRNGCNAFPRLRYSRRDTCSILYTWRIVIFGEGECSAPLLHGKNQPAPYSHPPLCNDAIKDGLEVGGGVVVNLYKFWGGF